MQNIRLASLQNKKRTIIQVSNIKFGEDFVVIAGPCSVESEEQTLNIAHAIKEAGASMIRGGAFKPRTSPYAFQGLGLKGLRILEKAKEETGLPVVSEVLDTRDVSWMCEYIDVLQIGARKMQNYSLRNGSHFYSSIGRSLSGLMVMPASTPGSGATGSVSRNFPLNIHSFRMVAISTARG